MPGMQMVLRPMGSVHLPSLMPATNEQATCAGLPAVKVSGGGMPPNVSFLTGAGAPAGAGGGQAAGGGGGLGGRWGGGGWGGCGGCGGGGWIPHPGAVLGC